MLLICPLCSNECTVDDLPDISVTCPACGQQISTRTGATLVQPAKETPASDVVAGWSVVLEETQDQPGAVRPRPVADFSVLPLRQGKYCIESLIDEGGFARVYLATDEELGRQVAIKIPRPERFATEAKLRQFLAEARTTAVLRHAGIVTVFDVGRFVNGTSYIAMEYVSGGTLSKFFEQGCPPVKKAVQMVIKIAEAIHEAHLRGLVHRDLKPSNILLDQRGEPRVVDFGLAVHETTQVRLRGEVSGTPAYMAPEQYRGEVQLFDGRTDIWSLGCILYVALTGRRPFNGDTGQLRDEILNKFPKPPRQIDDQIPSELETICLKCLAKTVEGRYTTAKDVADALSEWLNKTEAIPVARPWVAPEPTKVEPEKKTFSGRFRVVSGSVLLLAVAIILPMIVAATRPLKPIEDAPASRTAGSQQLALNPGQQDSKLGAIVAKPLDEEPLLRAIPLIGPGRIPRKLSWPSWHTEDTLDYSLDEARLSLQNPTSECFIALGDTTADAIVLETELTRAGASSSSGIFWGWQIDHLNPDHRSCFAVRIGSTSGPGQVRRHSLYVDHLTLAPRGVDQFTVVDYQTASAVDISANLRPERGRLTVEISRISGLHTISWGGQVFHELKDNANRFLKSQPKRHPPMRSAGVFGIYNDHGAVVVRNPVLKIVARKGN